MHLQLRTYTVEITSCILDTVSEDRYGQILVLHDGCRGKRFRQEHHVVFLPVLIQPVISCREQDVPCDLSSVHPPVVDGDLRYRSAVKRVQDLAVFQEHGVLVASGCHRIIDIIEPVGSAVLSRCHLEDPVRVDRPDGDEILHRARDPESVLFLSVDRSQCL